MNQPNAPERAVLLDRIRELSRPMLPEPTGVEERIVQLAGIRVVLFDLYGTLFVSASGDIGLARAAANAAALEDALPCAGLSCEGAGARGVELLEQTLRQCHASRRAGGVEHPEVEIRAVWRVVLQSLLKEGLVRAPDPGPEALSRLAVEYECRVNPVWPMPDLEETLQALRRKGLLLGIVSNAQFYTPLLFPALLKRTIEQMGFNPSLCVWSFESLEAKPSVLLFRRALDALRTRHGRLPAQTLYVGNDRLNDVWPAARAGCRTVLFAGGRRSLRLREDDPRCAGVHPDAVITRLSQLRRLIG